MALTIDHLRPGLSVRVLSAFADLRGINVPNGAQGVIVQLGMDWSTRNCFMEWDRAGRRETLWFYGRKTDSAPSNGSMRTFFEVESEVLVPQPAAAPAQLIQVDKKPERPEISLAQYCGKQPPDNTNLYERRVACDCDPRLHRSVMRLAVGVSVYGCLRCGTLTCTKSIGDDGRFTGDSWHQNLTIALSDRALAWIAQWPRTTTPAYKPGLWPLAGPLVRTDLHFLPADARCDTVEQLTAFEAHLALEQASLNNAQRLRQCGFPIDAPPSNLPQWLDRYAGLWRALQLRPDSPLDDLITHAQVDSPGTDVAADLLRQRPDYVALVLEWLRSDDRLRRSAGHALALLHTPGDPQLAAVVLEILESLPLTPLTGVGGRIVSCQRFEALLILVTELSLATPELLVALPRLQRKIARHDTDVAKDIGIAFRELHGLAL